MPGGQERIQYILLILPEEEDARIDYAVGVSANVMLYDQVVLRPSHMPNYLEEARSPELAARLEMLDRSCGRYFVRRAEDGSHYVPNAAVEARFPHG